MNRRETFKLSDAELLLKYDNEFDGHDKEEIRQEILRRMGLPWQGRQKAEAGRLGGLNKSSA